jgi:hypothetical protein
MGLIRENVDLGFGVGVVAALPGALPTEPQLPGTQHIEIPPTRPTLVGEQLRSPNPAGGPRLAGAAHQSNPSRRHACAHLTRCPECIPMIGRRAGARIVATTLPTVIRYDRQQERAQNTQIMAARAWGWVDPMAGCTLPLHYLRFRFFLAGGARAPREEQWVVERGIEIASEASRRWPDGLEARHPAHRASGSDLRCRPGRRSGTVASSIFGTEPRVSLTDRVDQPSCPPGRSGRPLACQCGQPFPIRYM